MFFCQRSSYSRELETNVISCKPAKRKLEMSGKKVDVAGFEVLFEDTVFFPEGGGQNTDKGTVQDIQVLDVTRKGTSAVHFITGELSEGKTDVGLGQKIRQHATTFRATFDFCFT